MHAHVCTYPSLQAFKCVCIHHFTCVYILIWSLHAFTCVCVYVSIGPYIHHLYSLFFNIPPALPPSLPPSIHPLSIQTHTSMCINLICEYIHYVHMHCIRGTAQTIVLCTGSTKTLWHVWLFVSWEHRYAANRAQNEPTHTMATGITGTIWSSSDRYLLTLEVESSYHEYELSL